MQQGSNPPPHDPLHSQVANEPGIDDEWMLVAWTNNQATSKEDAAKINGAAQEDDD